MSNILHDDRNGLAMALVSDAHNAIYISIQRDGKVFDEGDRWEFKWRVVNAHTNEEIGAWDVEGDGPFYSPAFGSEQDCDMRAAMQTLLSFMTAAGEAYMHENFPDNENGTLFDEKMMETCYQFSDEIAMLALELDTEGVDL